ncbi:MAG: glycosyltransferase family 4 protein [Chthoniobacteraceae bacterium]|nr:glycosyltransferase family 4 protein [Chthoniobacteraceae bacterium]
MRILDSPPRIALVSGCLKLGGSTTFLCNLGGELARRNIPVHVFSLEQGNPLAGDFQSLRIPVSILDDGPRIYEDRLAACAAALRAFEPTVVIGNLGPASFEVLRYMPQGIARVGVAHSNEEGAYRTLAIYRDHMDAVVGVSKIVTQRLQAMEAFSGKHVALIHCGIPMPSALSPADASGGPLRILYLGRLEDELKRVRLFPEIYRQLCASGIPFLWTVAGDGRERAFLEAEMKGGRPDQRVVFTGQVEYADVPALMDAQDVLLLVSSSEGLPLSLLETMGRGVVPVVSNLESGIPEVVNPANGMLVPVDDVPGYARALVYLHHHREELAEKRLQARAQVYPAYSTATMADRWLALAASFSSSAPARWPAKTDILPPLGHEHAFAFSLAGRWGRRLLRKLRR